VDRRELPGEDQALLGLLDTVRRALTPSPDASVQVWLAQFESALEDRLCELVGQVAAVAEANVHSVEIMGRLDELSEELTRQNDELKKELERAEAARQDLELQSSAVAEANVDALLAMEESEAAIEDLRLEQVEIARKKVELEQEAAALASANVEAAMMLEEREEQISKLVSQTQLIEKSRRELEEKAFVDDLTGLFNHRYFRENIRYEVERARRYNRELSVVFLDVDFFKKVNDTYGHPSGDVVLKKVASIIGESIRSADIMVRMDANPFAARYGGEEFVAILPETTVEGARVLAERIREAVEATTFHDVEGKEIHRITLSSGISCVCPSDDATTLVTRADNALYKAKQGGRNCVVIAPSPA
jgi:diguanylate cyclase (GGDEF)-like protein